MSSGPRFWAVVPAAGRGTRMGGEVPKQYLPLAGRTVIEHTLECLLAQARIAAVTVAVAADDVYAKRCLAHSWNKPVKLAPGGAQRAHSVLNALHSLRDELHADDWVLVHDAVRPCLHAEDLDKLMRTLERHAVGGILAAPLDDTVKQVGEDGTIQATPDRQKLWRAFTPQMFRYGLLHAALQTTLDSGRVPTDEAAAMETAHPGQVRVVEGRSDNIKITRPADVVLAEAILGARA
ncbi:MAG: 2-C-methyl-D-erythritol 4-phosphate cytidylyltransferase [Gammaproteobacteria bacterium]|nr:2-C-methyl-D-erythritol 4-phosphate cytidylyltransferase [Gammaproteobacteria bacterium]